MSRCSECARPLTQCDCVAANHTDDPFAANMILALEITNDRLTARLAVLSDAVRAIAEGFDHEEQTHDHQPFKYGGACRVCLAERALARAAVVGER